MILNRENRILVILGSTSAGKTDVAFLLAKKFNGELISCDSRQVYQGLDIGTGKFPGGEVKVKKGHGFWEMDEVKVWMYDVVEPSKQYTVYDYIQDANKALEDIAKRGKLPIIVGGTGLYLKALLEGLPNLVVPIDKKLRRGLERLSKEQLQIKLQQISSGKWENLNQSDRQNPRRLIRAIEFATTFDKNAGAISLIPTVVKTKLQAKVLKIGLIAPREILYKRIDARVISRFKQGMIDEAIKLHKAGLSLKRMWQLGLEYGVLAGFLSGKIKKENLVTVLQGKIHDYARRQLTWFKKERDVKWFDITEKGYMNKVENLITKWYDTLDATQN